MKLYAAYGSNMNFKQMARRCPKSNVLETGILKNYKLGFRGDGYANIRPCEGSDIPIVLWEITEDCEKELDEYEEYPKHYIKEEIVVKTKTGDKKAMIYVMTEDYKNLVHKPSTEYYNTIYLGYRDNGIPVSTLEQALKENK